MILSLIALPVSLIPAILLFIFLKKKVRPEVQYRKLCNWCLLAGALCSFVIVACSGVSYVGLKMSGVNDTYPLLYEFLYTFIVLALVEEFVKYITFRLMIQIRRYPYSWMDIIALMTIVGLGFDFLESLALLLTSGPAVLLIRGISIPHAGYAYIIGYFFGKAKKEGRPWLTALGFVASWLIHGLYDFSLSDMLTEVYPGFIAIALGIALLDLILVICLCIFIKRKKNDPVYTDPLPCYISKA